MDWAVDWGFPAKFTLFEHSNRILVPSSFTVQGRHKAYGRKQGDILLSSWPRRPSYINLDRKRKDRS